MLSIFKSNGLYFGDAMRDHIQLFQEDNGSITVEMDLQHYVPLFLRSNGQGRHLNPIEQQNFNAAFAEFNDHFAGVGAEDLMIEIQEYLLLNYPEKERAALRASPAFNLIYDAYAEIFKNAIDAFLEQQIINPENPATVVKLNINLEKFHDEVSITFADSGPGFPQPILDKLDTEENQLQYSDTHQGSQKRSAKLVGLMGSGGRGLRNIIALVLSGESLHPGKKVQRAQHFDSEIHFTNGNNPYCGGACMDITTQLAPIPELGAMQGMVRDSSATSHHSRPETSDSLSSRSKSSDLISDESKADRLFDLSLFVDELSLHDTSRLMGSSPMIQKTEHTPGLAIETEGQTDISSLSGSSPEILKKPLPSSNPENNGTTRRLDTASHAMPSRKQHAAFSPVRSVTTDFKQRFSKQTAADASKVLRSSHSTRHHSDIAAPISLINPKQSGPRHANRKSAGKKQFEYKSKMQSKLGLQNDPDIIKTKSQIWRK